MFMSMREHILQAIDAAGRIIGVSREIHDHPELRFQEHFAAKTLTGALESFGLAAEQPIGSLDTAFRAEFGREAKPKVAILAEYDALPDGHACGHDLSAGAALGATVGLAAVRDQLPGHEEGKNIHFDRRNLPTEDTADLTAWEFVRACVDLIVD